ncbi:permease-like cell division protein FtsX [uncultured Duncaniella sp.]|uniref:cell division protein FtsX n=1 Tax=uncultured Duncaniella sp. TaxID=2768039 RepID=UPI0025A9E171|nr:permease-like cell division protein FtsX [uncultured Duncaniella sp.]
MPKKRFHHIPLFSTRATATVSVALVLVILGIAALVGIAAHVLTQSVRDNMGFVIIFNDGVTADDISKITDGLKKCNSVSSTVYSSPDDILERWQKMVGEDENIMSLAGVNPFTPELEVKVTKEYACADSIQMLVAPINLMPQVSDVKVHNELIDSVNHTLHSVSLTLVCIAVALLVVSFVLIFNTVRLSVYSKRFLINTMQLVGATSGFIRRPFLMESVVNGAVAGVFASGIVAAMLYYCQMFAPSVKSVLEWRDALMVMVAMIIIGMVICLVAAVFACNRYLSLSYDELYK